MPASNRCHPGQEEQNNLKQTDMKTIKKLEVAVTYTVELSDVSVSDDVHAGLMKCYDERGGCIPSEYEVCSSEAESAREWLSENIREADSIDWECEIEEMKD